MNFFVKSQISEKISFESMNISCSQATQDPTLFRHVGEEERRRGGGEEKSRGGVVERRRGGEVGRTRGREDERWRREEEEERIRGGEERRGGHVKMREGEE